MTPSIARPTRSFAPFWSTLATDAKIPAPAPNVMLPNARRDTIKPVSPKRAYCIVYSFRPRSRDPTTSSRRRSARPRSLLHAPRRHVGPFQDRRRRARGRLVAVARRARIRHLVELRRGRRNEAERVAAHVEVADLARDLRHVAVDALHVADT